MQEGADFALEDRSRTPREESIPSQPPLVVIEYRDRGIAAKLLPALLILLVALMISSYQRRNPVRLSPHTLSPDGQRLDPPPRVSSVPDRTPIKVRAEKHEAPPEKESDKPPALSNKEKPEQRPNTGNEAPQQEALASHGPLTRSPFDLDPTDGLQPLENVVEAPPEPGPEPATAPPIDGEPESSEAPPTAVETDVPKEEILGDIQREADRKDAERQDLEQLKPRAHALLLSEALAKIQESRLPFRNDLRELLKNQGKKSGPQIDQLCEQYGREKLPEVGVAYARALRNASPRMGWAEKVRLMRSLGVPEPLILDQLARGIHPTLNSRGGPRDEDEVRVKAAELLMSIPIRPTRRNPSSLPMPATANGSY
ncbi:MAG: hypothetical protein NVSMB9_04840 [Isosphaeraceae bacterium]